MITKGKFSQLKSLIGGFMSDERGGETVEWVLVVALISVVCMVAMKEFGFTLTARWNEVVDLL